MENILHQSTPKTGWVVSTFGEHGALFEPKSSTKFRASHFDSKALSDEEKGSGMKVHS